mgnify:CR=1 FL=1
MLAVARRGLAAAINDAENGIGHLSCDDPKIMEQVRAHWRRLYDTYMNADALLSDLESCARHLTDGDKWEPNPIADGMKPMAGGMGRRARPARRPQVEDRTQGDSLMHRGFCTDCGAYAALGENDRCAACDAWRHREEERRDHV